MFSGRRTPPNRFTGTEVAWEIPPEPGRLELIEDASRSALSRSESPNAPFRWGLNPYRGCTHACAYCFARTYHEFLGYDVGEDFERRIVIKRELPALLAAELRRGAWSGEPIVMSGITDPYQPIERRLQLSRGCLEVLAAHRNPTVIITRSPLVTRDLDWLAALAAHGAVRVNVSIPVGDPEVVRLLEPGAAGPGARLRAVGALADAGIPVGVSLAPVIPGLTDHAIPETLRRAREAGAGWAWWDLLRLPRGVDQLFEGRLRDALPDRADGVLRRLREARAASDLAGRGAGRGAAWDATLQLASLTRRRLGFEEPPPFPSPFRVPGRQLSLF